MLHPFRVKSTDLFGFAPQNGHIITDALTRYLYRAPPLLVNCRNVPGSLPDRREILPLTGSRPLGNPAFFSAGLLCKWPTLGTANEYASLPARGISVAPAGFYFVILLMVVCTALVPLGMTGIVTYALSVAAIIITGVVLIQGYRDTAAIQAKLDEIVIALREARNNVVGLEHADRRKQADGKEEEEGVIPYCSQ